MNDFIEQQIIGAVQGLLTGKVNEIINEMESNIPLIEFSEYRGGNVVTPVISLANCERTEKERIIRLDAYSLTITLSIPDTANGEADCYAYSGVISRVFLDNPTLGGIADRAVITGKKYVPPKKANCGQGWELILSLRVTIESMRKEQ
jgi:hypothetical protein